MAIGLTTPTLLYIYTLRIMYTNRVVHIYHDSSYFERGIDALKVALTTLWDYILKKYKLVCSKIRELKASSRVHDFNPDSVHHHSNGGVHSRIAHLQNRPPQERNLIKCIGGLSLLSLLLFIGMVIAAAIAGSRKQGRLCQSKDCIATASMFLQNMDVSADPCQDFFRYACGRYDRHHPIPDSKQSIDWFLERKITVRREIRDMLMQLGPSDYEPNAIKQLRLFFADCQNLVGIENKRLKPLQALLKDLNVSLKPSLLQQGETGDTNPKFEVSLTSATAKRIAGLDVLLGASVYPDPLNNTKNIFGLAAPNWKSPFPLELYRLDWSLPNPLKAPRQNLHRAKRQSPPQRREVRLRLKYMASLMKKLLELGIDDESDSNVTTSIPINEMSQIEEAANKIHQFEGKLYTLANRSISDIDFAMLSFDELQNMTDNFSDNKPQNKLNWQVYFTQIFNGTNVTLAEVEAVQVQMSYVQNLAKLLSNTPPAVVEGAIWWQVVDTTVTLLMRALKDVRRNYIEELTSGQSPMSRSMVCAEVANDLMGMAVSYLFATPSFVQAAEEKVGQMVSDIRDSFVEMVSGIDWMDEPTRQATLRKANFMKVYIAFPKWMLKNGALDYFYNGVTLAENSYYDNALTMMKYFTKKMFSSITKPNYGETWASDPTDVNAYYSFQENAITVPAAILQFPFYNLGLEVLNYGAIGSILGHELTHGFDNLGRLYDEHGNFRPWWTNVTAKEYERRTSCFVEQYGKFHLDEVHANVDGYITLGENIADNGGIRHSVLAYRKLRERLGSHREEESLPGLEHLEPEQLLYLSFANLWCEQSTLMVKKWSLGEAHAPNKARIWGTLSNSRSFSETWKCPIHSPMNPRHKCELW